MVNTERVKEKGEIQEKEVQYIIGTCQGTEKLRQYGKKAKSRF